MENPKNNMALTMLKNLNGLGRCICIHDTRISVSWAYLGVR